MRAERWRSVLETLVAEGEASGERREADEAGRQTMKGLGCQVGVRNSCGKQPSHRRALRKEVV